MFDAKHRLVLAKSNLTSVLSVMAAAEQCLRTCTSKTSNHSASAQTGIAGDCNHLCDKQTIKLATWHAVKQCDTREWNNQP